jgi:hypothetical protein
MSSIGPFTQAVLNSVAAIFRDDFEGRFRSLYEDTIDMLRLFPREPEGEVFNAFEHCSLACKLAAEADDSSTSMAAVNAAKSKAQISLGQARRHLSVGRFFCIEHQILFAMNRIRNYVASLPEDVREEKAFHQQQVDELERELRVAEAIDIKPIYDVSELERAMTEFEKDIERMTKLLVRFLKLADDILGPAEVPPPAPA